MLTTGLIQFDDFLNKTATWSCPCRTAAAEG